MIINIENCNNEKYFNSIRYFYHLEDFDVKKDSILDKLIEYNIVLAASCLATDQKNELRERKIIEIAINQAKDFIHEENSTKALLALSELKEYSTILNIFNDISKPQMQHKQVLRKVFQQADEGVFLRFIENFTNYQYFNLISTEFLDYPKKIIPNNESLLILKKFIVFLNEKKLIGFVRLFLEKYELLGHVVLFFEKQMEDLILGLLIGHKKEIYLGYSILNYNNYGNRIGKEKVLTLLSQASNKSTTLSIAIDFAIKNNIYNHTTLNEKLFNLIKTGKKKNLIKLLTLLRSGLFEYCKKVETLDSYLRVKAIEYGINIEKFEYQRQKKDSESRSENLGSIINQYNSNEGIERFVNELLDIEIYSNETKDPLTLFWCRYFVSKNETLKNIPIEVFIERSESLFDIDMRGICHVLREFECVGYLVNSTERGFYVRSNDFRSLKTMFLHRDMCTEAFLNRDISNSFSFRIVGYNPITKRINISLLQVGDLKT